MSGTRAISTTSRRQLSSTFFFFLQGKAPKEFHSILTETLACFLSGRVKDLSAPLQMRGKNKLGSMPKEVVVARFKAISRHMPGGTGKKKRRILVKQVGHCHTS